MIIFACVIEWGKIILLLRKDNEINSLFMIDICDLPPENWSNF